MNYLLNCHKGHAQHCSGVPPSTSWQSFLERRRRFKGMSGFMHSTYLELRTLFSTAILGGNIKFSKHNMHITPKKRGAIVNLLTASYSFGVNRVPNLGGKALIGTSQFGTTRGESDIRQLFQMSERILLKCLKTRILPRAQTDSTLSTL